MSINRNSRSNMSTEGYDTVQSPNANKRANNRMFVANRGAVGVGAKNMRINNNDDLDYMMRNPSNKDMESKRKMMVKGKTRDTRKIEAKIDEGDARANDELEFAGWHSTSQKLAIYG